jgi:hypothetical protein
MTQEHKDFLVENINNWHTAQNGYVRNLDLPLLKMYEHIYRTHLDANFVLTHWCGGCKMEMITRLYKYYESLPTENIEEKKEILIELINDNFEEDSVITFITEEPKKKGRKPKKNG